MDRSLEMKRLNDEYRRLPGSVKRWDLSKRFVPAEGPANAKVMLIGQAPGRNEDIERRPFIGTSGKFLDKLIHIAGLNRKDIYIASVVQFFPPKNRLPTREETSLCSEFLFRQIKMVNPKVIVLLGSVACKTVLGVDKIASVHGTVVKRDGITYLLSLHPAAAIRIRKNMPLMERDFRRFNTIIKRQLLV